MKQTTVKVCFYCIESLALFMRLWYNQTGQFYKFAVKFLTFWHCSKSTLKLQGRKGEYL